jgi:hypothetical protein
MRRVTCLVLLAVTALVYPMGSSAAPAPSPTHAAKLKKCKPGLNTKKCRCPKGQKLVKKGLRYRCKKKAVPQQGQPDNQQGPDNTNTDPGTGTGTNTDPGTGTTTDPGTNPGTTPGTNPGGAQTQRDDAGYRAALAAASRIGPRTDDGNYGGISTYTYDFCANGQFSHRYEYSYNGTGSDTYYNGTWELEQGFKLLQSTNGAKWAGILVVRETDGSASRIEVDLNDSAAQLVVGNSAHLTGGLFSRSASVC